MSASDALLRRYLPPTRGAPWRWSTDGMAVELLDGTTLAFRTELAQALERSGLQGFPPFGSVVYLFLACHERWTKNAELRGHLLGILNFTLRGRAIDLPALLKRLDAIGQLSDAVRKGLDAKAFLLASVFENGAPALSREEGLCILKGLRDGVPPEWLAPHDEDGGDSILRDLQALQGAGSLTEAGLLARRETGLDAPSLAPPELELPDSLRVRHLLDTLRDDGDAELAGLARLALNLLAAVHVPRPLTHDDELPLGGYTDIVNRGSLDRLLLSELAHDDTTLAARVALNEALDLRREAPPRNPWIDRAILIDAGLRMWGLPRVYATAAALALAAAGTARTHMQVYRAEQKACVRVDLSTREGLVEHLAALEPEAHPGPALQTLLEKDALQAPSELTLITHPDAFLDPEFRASLPRHRDIFVATVDRTGAFELRAASALGSRDLCTARLDLEKILTEQPARARRSAPRQLDPALPLVLAMDPFPLRVPHAILPCAYGYSEVNGLFAVSRDGRLTWWPAPNKAPKTLSTAVPAGKVLRVEVRETRVLVLITRQRPNEVLLFKWDIVQRRHAISTLRTEGGLPKHIEINDELLALVFGSRILTFNIDSGERVKELELPHGTAWVHGRYFRREKQWRVLNLASGAGELLETKIIDNNWLILFDRDNGPWGVHPGGAVISALDLKRIDFPGMEGISHVERVSRDGNRLLVLNGARVPVLLNVKQESARSLKHTDNLFLEGLLEPDAGRFLHHPFSLRTRLKSIAFDRDGAPVFTTRKNALIALNDSRSDRRMHICEYDPDPAEALAFAPFEPVDGRGGFPFELSVARLPGGNRIYLDSRGMLHFVPAAGAQISLVLFDTHVTGWSSDGVACVDEFFGHVGQPLSDSEFFLLVTAFGRRCR